MEGKRFIDDIFLIWIHGEEDLLELFESLNEFHETIKFTFEISKHSLKHPDIFETLESVTLLESVGVH